MTPHLALRRGHGMGNSGRSFRPTTDFRKWPRRGAWVQGGATDDPRHPAAGALSPTAKPRASFHSNRQGAVHLAFSEPPGRARSQLPEKKTARLRQQLPGMARFEPGT